MFENRILYSVNSTGDRRVVRRDDLEYELEDDEIDPSDIAVLPITEVTSQELAELIREELENANYHSLTSIGERMLKKLASFSEVSTGEFSETQKRAILWALASTLDEIID